MEAELSRDPGLLPQVDPCAPGHIGETQVSAVVGRGETGGKKKAKRTIATGRKNYKETLPIPPGIPRCSPNQVLTRTTRVQLPTSDKTGRIQPVGTCLLASFPVLTHKPAKTKTKPNPTRPARLGGWDWRPLQLFELASLILPRKPGAAAVGENTDFQGPDPG